ARDRRRPRRRARREGPRNHEGARRPARGWPGERQRHPGQRLRKGRGVRRGHARGTRREAPRFYPADGPGEGGDRPERDRPQREEDARRAPPDLPRPPDLRGAQAPLRGLPGPAPLPPDRGGMSRRRVYLSGGIEHSGDGGRGWRREIGRFLAGELGQDVYDPALDEKKDLTDEERRNLRPWKLESPERFRDTVRKIIAWDLGHIERESDYLLAFWDDSAARGGG